MMSSIILAMLTQQTRDAGPTPGYCWANVVDVGSTVNLLCSNIYQEPDNLKK